MGEVLGGVVGDADGETGVAGGGFVVVDIAGRDEAGEGVASEEIDEARDEDVSGDYEPGLEFGDGLGVYAWEYKSEWSAGAWWTGTGDEPACGDGDVPGEHLDGAVFVAFCSAYGARGGRRAEP